MAADVVLKRHGKILMNWEVAFRSSARVLLVLATTVTCVGCGYFAARDLAGAEVPAPPDFGFVGEKSPCYLELQQDSKALRMNCFHIGGVLHIHSSRWAKLPRLSGESWTVTVRRSPNVRVEIEDKTYSLKASPIDDESHRKSILHDRGYWYAWDGVSVFRFTPNKQGEFE